MGKRELLRKLVIVVMVGITGLTSIYAGMKLLEEVVEIVVPAEIPTSAVTPPLTISPTTTLWPTPKYIPRFKFRKEDDNEDD